MGKKGKNGGFECYRSRGFYQAFQYFTVSDMYPVKCAYGDGRGMTLVVIGDALDCYHVLKVIKGLYLGLFNSSPDARKITVTFLNYHSISFLLRLGTGSILGTSGPTKCRTEKNSRSI